MMFTKVEPDALSTKENLSALTPSEMLPQYKPDLTVFWTLFTVDLFLAILFSFESVSQFHHSFKRVSVYLIRIVKSTLSIGSNCSNSGWLLRKRLKHFQEKRRQKLTGHSRVRLFTQCCIIKATSPQQARVLFG